MQLSVFVLTFRKGRTKGRSGKFVASWNCLWKSSGAIVEFTTRTTRSCTLSPTSGEMSCAYCRIDARNRFNFASCLAPAGAGMRLAPCPGGEEECRGAQDDAGPAPDGEDSDRTSATTGTPCELGGPATPRVPTENCCDISPTGDEAAIKYRK
jgi:hypothetical protein